MKIDYLNSDGIHASEKEAIERMRQTFNESELSRAWHGYAAFMMMDVTYRDREIDLVLLTHDRLLIIELKKWRGKITPMHDHWLKDDNDMGRSPVLVLADKWKILSSKIQARLKAPARAVFIDYLVVMCGTADYSELPVEERSRIIGLEQFLKIAKPNGYRQILGDSKGIKACQHTDVFTPFFRGKDFKPSTFSFNNFQIVGETTFPHPDGLFKEYKSVKKDDQRHEALLRRWDFSALAGIADTLDERERIALREHQVLGFIHEQNENLDAVVLQPLSHPTREDVNADFCELYRLPSRQSRLSDFVNRHGPDIAAADRVALVKVLLSHFADLHDAGVAHRDISDHSIWLELPSKVSISGFIASYFPEVRTVGTLRDNIRAGKAVLPEDSEIGAGTASDPFRRDVFLLGVVAHHLLYLRPPAQSSGIHIWTVPEPDEYAGQFSSWLQKSLELSPSDRFANAREMLNALNGIQGKASEVSGLDLRVFETYRSAVIPMVVYPILENISQGHSHVYKSILGSRDISVKVWYGKRPDRKQPEEAYALLGFLERARQIKNQPCESLAAVIDFGISDAGAYLVQDWVEGKALTDILKEQLTVDDALMLGHEIVRATLHLHGLGFNHGDIHPGNIVLDAGKVRFIDAIDILVGDAHNPAYVPIDYESVSLQQRDCYAVAKICSEIISRVADWKDVDKTELNAELGSCIGCAPKVYTLDLIDDAFARLLSPPTINEAELVSVALSRSRVKEKLISDNGHFHIGVYAEENPRHGQEKCVVVSVAGVRKRLLVYLHPMQLEVERVVVQDIQHSQFVAAASKAIDKLKCMLEVVPSQSDDLTPLLDALDQLPAYKDSLGYFRRQLLKLDDVSDDEAEQDLPSTEHLLSPKDAPPTADIWKAILEAEESTLPEVEIIGPISREFGRRGKVRIPYSNAGEALDYDSNSKVEALQEVNGELTRIGEVDIQETTPSILVLDLPAFKFQQNLGDKIKLRSQQDLSSFRRRRLAINRILKRESVIPNLIDYFDPARCPAPSILESDFADEVLDVYSRFDEDGNLAFSLNEQQRKAFKRLWANGPVSLLQGPPGTGKTAFIASFIHHAMSQGAQSILLASQSHEAVNNAAERVIELCRGTDMKLDVVRFGAEGMVSDQLRPFHSSSILQAYRDLFKSEMRSRVAALSRNLALPHDFVTTWFDIDFYLLRLHDEIEKLQQKLSEADESTKSYRTANAKIGQRLERFYMLAYEKFGWSDRGKVPEEVISALHDEALRAHSVTSLDAVLKLKKVLAMAKEWVDRLGVLRGNFEEFLAKTRSLVCGTCVGLGRSQFGVANNRYDWVIVDEAARATPGELAVAIQSGRRVLLVGDHRQLPPLYKKELTQHISSSLKWSDHSTLTRSDFERAFESKYGQEVGATLKTQYRMAPPIGDLVSCCFYPTRLEAGRSDPKPWYQELTTRARAVVTWVDTSNAGRESLERKKERNGFDNIFEAREIIDLLRSICTTAGFIKPLLEICGDDEKPIGVICMYAEQKRLLLRLMSEQDWATGLRHLIKIDTVDSYQGKENRIIILSLTRNNSRFEQGFLSSPERINVAISRAMDRLIIVGASKMWRDRHQSSPMGRVLAHIDAAADGNSFAVVNVTATGGGAA